MGCSLEAFRGRPNARVTNSLRRHIALAYIDSTSRLKKTVPPDYRLSNGAWQQQKKTPAFVGLFVQLFSNGTKKPGRQNRRKQLPKIPDNASQSFNMCIFLKLFRGCLQYIIVQLRPHKKVPEYRVFVPLWLGREG